MCYVITDGSYYINSTGGIHLVNHLYNATKMKKEKANNVLHAIPKILRKYDWKIEYAEVMNGEAQDVAKPKQIDYSILDKVIEIESFAKDLQERNLYLKARLQEIELEIVDIEHAAEFYTLNASQGYKIYKMLHESRVERREVKNEMEKIKYIMNSSMNSALYNKISKSVEGVNTKQYTPRVLKELFGA